VTAPEDRTHKQGAIVCRRDPYVNDQIAERLSVPELVALYVQAEREIVAAFGQVRAALDKLDAAIALSTGSGSTCTRGTTGARCRGASRSTCSASCGATCGGR
jgi:hypothetical protein